MNREPWAIRGRRVVTSTGVVEAVLVIEGEKIVEVGPPGRVPKSIEIKDFGDLVVLPGLVDTHVHINDPGRADWEGSRRRRPPPPSAGSRRWSICRSTATR